MKLRIILITIVLSLSILWAKCQWDECREMGFSIMYCIQHLD